MILHQSKKQSRHPPHYKQMEEFQAESYVSYLIWDSKDTSLHGIAKDLGQLILEKDWIGPL